MAETVAVRDDAPAPAGTFREWIDGAPLSRETHFLIGLVAPALVLVANMWRVRTFTIDDAYISYRFARNFARGLGLVYNPGERIEGYTNFLWTVLLAGGIKLGIDPDVLAKLLGGAFALGSLGVVYLLSERFQPFTNFPCVSTWLLSTTVVFTGYAVFGLETSLYIFLVLYGTWLLFREEPAYGGAVPSGPLWRQIPWSGVVFGLAGLTRPEAPMFLGIPMLYLGLGIFSLRNILRGTLFVAIVGAHMLWRHAYYGAWVPNTLTAKTGNLSAQIDGGLNYIQNYFTHAGPLLWLALFGFAMAVVGRHRDRLAIGTLAAAILGYVVVVGGDWMPYFRFMGTFEPLCFLLVDVAARSIFARKNRIAGLALVLFGVAMVVHRIDAIRDAQRQIVKREERFWTMAAGGTAKWLLENNDPGEIAIGDIGYVGYATDYPLLDLLGLVDPVISKLPGGYTHKLGPGFLNRFFDKAPKYFLLISSSTDCRKPSVPGSQVIYRDPRFRPRYEVAGTVPLDGGFAWCIYRKKGEPTAK